MKNSNAKLQLDQYSILENQQRGKFMHTYLVIVATLSMHFFVPVEGHRLVLESSKQNIFDQRTPPYLFNHRSLKFLDNYSYEKTSRSH